MVDRQIAVLAGFVATMMSTMLLVNVAVPVPESLKTQSCCTSFRVINGTCCLHGVKRVNRSRIGRSGLACGSGEVKSVDFVLLFQMFRWSLVADAFVLTILPYHSFVGDNTVIVFFVVCGIEKWTPRLAFGMCAFVAWLHLFLMSTIFMLHGNDVVCFSPTTKPTDILMHESPVNFGLMLIASCSILVAPFCGVLWSIATFVKWIVRSWMPAEEVVAETRQQIPESSTPPPLYCCDEPPPTYCSGDSI